VADLEGKTVIIAGVGPGLGRETALVAVREGANVALGARTESTLKAVADEVDPSGARVAYVATDITDEADCQQLVATTVQRFGRVDALVNCAALDTLFGGLDSADDFSGWRATFDVNLFGSLQMTRAALAELRRRGGAVVFVSSQTQHHPPPLAIQMAYAASKSALTGAMRHLAHEVGGDGVRVNEIAPGWMWGPPVEGFVNMTADRRGVGPEVVLGELTAHMPLKRMATDGEVAEAIVFFASDRAAAITGQTLLINAGEIMR
jgi:NAD(P)-dependent dehydrogenase (short-subunit alcohol dehydrogenase family)